MPRVSILIPCYNAAPWVEEAIASAVAQTHPAIEVLIRDDGSTDDSLSRIKTFASHPGVHWESGPNEGGNRARNRLLRAAAGEFVQFLDADDILHPEKLTRQLAAYDEATDLVFCNFSAFASGDPRTGSTPLDYPDAIGDVMSFVMRHGILTGTPLHRRGLLQQVNGFAPDLPRCQEYELHLRLSRLWRQVKKLDERLYFHRQVHTSISAERSKLHGTKADVLTRFVRRLPPDELTSRRREAAAATLVDSGRHLVRHRDPDKARACFRIAREVAPAGWRPGSGAFGALCRCVGPLWAERLREVVKPPQRATAQPAADPSSPQSRLNPRA